MKVQVRSRRATVFKVLKTVGILSIVGVVALLFWRIATSGAPSSMKGLEVNGPVYDAWKAADEEHPLTIYNQKQDPITRANKNYGYFSVTDVKFIEEAAQVQVLFRYNNSTIRHLVEDYKLDTMPGRGEDLYDVTLYVAYDLTPDVTTDNDGNDPASVKFVRYFPTSQTSAQKSLYNYRKFVFDGVDMTVTENPVLAVYVDIYYREDIDYDKEPYGTLIIYDYASDNLPCDLSGNDRKKLEAFRKESAD